MARTSSTRRPARSRCSARSACRRPSYAHLPLVVGPDGKKLGKRDGALPLESLDAAARRGALAFALAALGQEPADSPEEALRRFDPGRVPIRRPAGAGW